ncbi:BamA/TamA family outer membrane protein [Ramlibacter terrae]|uniref:BamA/TamA family outer membrane protein n=1 Tax=Ramlibacter terrae TaxID=2732511 RepID=A0ABX6P385_9BURK|nr:BamA/TamA family outer membrane protein [Ramlibacter terrae]
MAQQPSFDLVVRSSNDDLRELLETHLEIRRFREVTDLDDAELARLIVIAEKDARELLATQGFFSPEVRIAREAGAARPQLVVTVEPGTQAGVAGVEINFEGDISTSEDPDAVAQRRDITSDWGLPAGRASPRTGGTPPSRLPPAPLVAKRYPAGRISYSVADVDAATNEARLGLKLDSGALFRPGTLQVTGMERYDPILVPRLARLPVGMVYDQEKIVQAQLRLAASGYFDSAFIFVDPEGDPDAAPVQVTVREAPMQKVVLGVGITTDGGPRLTPEHTHNRLPAIGWRAQTKLQLEKRNPLAQTEWTSIPAEDGWRWGVLARADRLDDDRVFTRSQQLRAGRLRNEDHIDRNVYVQYERSSVSNPRGVVLTPLELGQGSAISAHYAWTGRYFDDITSPTSGFGVGFEVGAGVTLAGDHAPFQRTLFKGLAYKPLERGRIQFRGQLGAVLARDNAAIPATQLFRTGGDTTVRGYKYLDIGVPLGGDYVGPGRFMVVGSAEWQRPLRRGGRTSDWKAPCSSMRAPWPTASATCARRSASAPACAGRARWARSRPRSPTASRRAGRACTSRRGSRFELDAARPALDQPGAAGPRAAARDRGRRALVVGGPGGFARMGPAARRQGQPLQTDGVQGSVRNGWRIQRMVWEKDGLRIEALDITLKWQPLALLSRTLRVDRSAWAPCASPTRARRTTSR